MKLCTLLLGLMAPVISMACLNKEAHTLKDGYDIYQDQEGDIIPHGHLFMVEDSTDSVNEDYHVETRLARLDRMWKKTGDIGYWSDYGLVLIIAGRYKEAINLYLEIEDLHPGRYTTASNIGTAYELIGNNQEALKWIKRSIEINPSAHYNSEWLHVKILEAKLKGDEYVTSDFLLGHDFGDALTPVSSLAQDDLIKLRDALFFQLNERMSFIKSPDKIVATLLFELGNIAWLTNAKYEAARIYDIADYYGMSGDLFKQRKEHTLDWINIAPLDYESHQASILHEEVSVQAKSFPTGYIVLAVCTVALILLFALYFRNNQVSDV